MKNKATVLALIGILTSVLGFYFNTVVSDIRKTASLVYSLETKGAKLTLRVQNVSAVEAIVGGTYSVICRTKENTVPTTCMSDEILKPTPPVWLNGISENSLQHAASTLNVELDLPPGGAFEVYANLSDVKNNVLFFLFSQSKEGENAKPVTLIQGQRGTSFVLTNFHRAMATAFAASFFLTLVLTIWLSWDAVTRKEKVPDDGEKDNSPSVFVLSGSIISSSGRRSIKSRTARSRRIRGSRKDNIDTDK